MITRKKDPQKQAQGRLNRARGQQFEELEGDEDNLPFY